MAFKPVPFESFGGMATRWSPEKLPPGYSQTAKDVKFVGGSVGSRDGCTPAFKGPNPVPITGLTQFISLHGDNVPVAFDENGTLFSEVPAGSGGVPGIIADSLIGPYMEADTTLNELFLAFSDLKTGTNAPKIYYKPLSDINFHFDQVGLPPQSTPPGGSASSGTLGDIATGVRYCVVLFQTLSGYISGMTNGAVFKVNVVASNEELIITGIPTGPANVTARIVAFTEAGASSAGPFFWINAGTTLQELNNPITATFIPDNVTTSIQVNFSDSFLVAANDVTDFFNKIQLPFQASVYFSPTLRRLIWAGEPNNPNIFRVSLPDDPESYLGTTGFVEPGNGDKQACITAREFRGEVYLLKTESGYSVADSSTEPSTWRTTKRWDKIGPTGPRAVDVSATFMAIAAHNGLYLWDGANMTWASYEVQGGEAGNGMLNWDRINKDYAHLIYVFVDEYNKEIRIGVPLDQATSISHEFVMNYANGIGAKGRRWSYNVLQFTSMFRMFRPVTGDGVDNRIKVSQLCGASANPTGQVVQIDPSSTTDCGQPIFPEFETAFFPPPTYGTIHQWGGADVSVKGVGQLLLDRASKRATYTPLRTIPLDGEKFVDHAIRGTGQSERFTVRARLSDAGGSFLLQRITAYLNPIWQRRTF